MSGSRDVLAERVVRKDVTEAGSINVHLDFIVEVEITQNQGFLRFENMVLKKVLEFTQKEANCGLFSF